MLNYLRILIQELRKLYFLRIKLPKNFPQHHIRSIVAVQILESNHQLFIEENVLIKNSNIQIGKHTYIGNNTIIDACKYIGNFCSISSNVKIGMSNHPLSYISTSPVFYSSYRKWLNKSTFNESETKTVIIEDDVLISANVVIINDVKIGRGAVIGAGSVVAKDVPPYAIVAGVPAKIIRYRFSNEIIEKIEKSKWWEKDDDKLKSATQFANNPELFISKI